MGKHNRQSCVGCKDRCRERSYLTAVQIAERGWPAQTFQRPHVHDAHIGKASESMPADLYIGAAHKLPSRMRASPGMVAQTYMLVIEVWMSQGSRVTAVVPMQLKSVLVKSPQPTSVAEASVHAGK